jgi:hypothetical protein
MREGMDACLRSVVHILCRFRTTQYIVLLVLYVYACVHSLPFLTTLDTFLSVSV